MIEFLCPNCGMLLRGKDDYAGRDMKCPSCEKNLTVPSAPPVSDDGGDAVLQLAEDHAPAGVPKRSVPLALRMNASELAPGVREAISQSAALVEQQKRDAEAIAAAKAKLRDIQTQKPGTHDAAATEDRQKAAIAPHNISTKWEYAQWITEDMAGIRTEEFTANGPGAAFVSYDGDSDSPARGKFLSQLLGQPEAEGYATDAEILNAIGSNGWELVKNVERAKYKETETSTVTRTFKRPRSDATSNLGKAAPTDAVKPTEADLYSARAKFEAMLREKMNATGKVGAK